MEKKKLYFLPSKPAAYRQGDQIGRICANWAIV
jgi:hypothetical protein